ncbi:unnamed protein product [Allacma fusca]|uniref:Uncharacterized protein n=1 Tax=Allacma fusca TaxID=39272 RepID=A0A8J2P486_9HEXA|nr:unnamed protein product [Allacma fusca]
MFTYLSKSTLNILYSIETSTLSPIVINLKGWFHNLSEDSQDGVLLTLFACLALLLSLVYVPLTYWQIRQELDRLARDDQMIEVIPRTFHRKG